MGNKPAVNATKRRKMAHGNAKPSTAKGWIVKSTEQAGAFTLYADSDRLQSDQVSLFTGKKDQAERTVLGVEPVRQSAYLGKPTLPSKVNVVYSDGKAQKKPLNGMRQTIVVLAKSV